MKELAKKPLVLGKVLPPSFSLKMGVQDWFYVFCEPFIKGKIGSWIYENY